MDSLEPLLEQNKTWAEQTKQNEPDFFEKLAGLQTPEFLWIGCSDSRMVPAPSVGLLPGEMFVHRNIANLVIHSDLNCLSVIQFAVEFLRVKHIIVCGHYGCGGVTAALHNTRLGLIDNWLRQIQNLVHKYERELEEIPDEIERLDKLCEINVIEQVVSTGETTILQDAWARGQNVKVHGWIYRIADGIYRDLHVTLRNVEDLENLRLKTMKQRPETGVAK